VALWSWRRADYRLIVSLSPTRAFTVAPSWCGLGCRSRIDGRIHQTHFGGYKRSIPGALLLATTFKCKFVAQMTSLSSSELLACVASAVDGSAAADEEAATGESGSDRHNNTLICS
jgi:hypothetical protein